MTKIRNPIEGDQIPLFELLQDEPAPPPRPKPTGRIIVKFPMKVGGYRSLPFQSCQKPQAIAPTMNASNTQAIGGMGGGGHIG